MLLFFSCYKYKKNNLKFKIKVQEFLTDYLTISFFPIMEPCNTTLSILESMYDFV